MLKGCLVIVVLIVLVHVASCIFAIGRHEWGKFSSWREAHLAEKARQTEEKKIQEAENARIAATIRQQKEAAAEAKRRQVEKDEKIQTFALKEAPKVWAVYQALQGEIDVQNSKIGELRKTLETFGKLPEQDADFKRICALRDEMIRSHKALRTKLEDAYIAAKKCEASLSRKDYQELHKKALEDGILEADAASAKFKEMRLNK